MSIVYIIIPPIIIPSYSVRISYPHNIYLYPFALVDAIDEEFYLNQIFIGFGVLVEGKLVLKAELDNETFAYDMDELDKWIANFEQLRY